MVNSYADKCELLKTHFCYSKILIMKSYHAENSLNTYELLSSVDQLVRALQCIAGLHAQFLVEDQATLLAQIRS